VDIALNQAVGGFRYQHRPGLSPGLQACGEMRGVAHGSVVHTQVIANATHHDQARVEPQAQAELHPVVALELGIIPPDGLLERQPRLHGPEGVILQGHGGPGPSVHPPGTDSPSPRSGGLPQP